MPIFEYKGANNTGQQVKGTLQAENLQQAKAKLTKDDIFIFQIQSKTGQKKQALSGLTGKKVDIKTLCNMTRLLSVLIKSKVPLVDSLTTVTGQMSHPVLSPALTQIRNQVNEGQAFHKALSQYPRIFSPAYISLCEAGENSGTLDIILLKLAEWTENQAELSNKIRSAMAYPLLITGFAFCITLFLFTYVIPKITELFEDPNLISWETKLIMSTSQFIIDFYPHIGVFLGLLIFVMFQWVRTPSGKEKLDRFYLKLPFVGKIVRASAIARFSRTLATLLKGGVPMLKSMDIVQNVAQNTVLKQAIQKARSHIREGESIAQPLEESGQFPPMTIQMIKTGEKTGELEEMLIKISDTYDFQVNTEINTLTSLLAPVMIMLMGSIVAFIIFSVITPIMQMYNQI